MQWLGTTRASGPSSFSFAVLFLRDISKFAIFYKVVLRTSAVSSANLGSILIFASCVVGTLVINYVGEFLSLNGKGPIMSFLFFFFFSTMMVSVGLFPSGGGF